MAEFNRLPTQAELDRILFQQSLGNKTTQQIINENLSGGGFTNQDNIAQRMATGAGIAKQAVNKLGNVADIAKLLPGYTGQKKVSIPINFNFASKQDPMGGIVPQGLQTQQINVDQLLRAIKPADVLGITGAESAYSDIGAGKAPSLLDVADVAGLGATGIGVTKGLLAAGKSLAPNAAEMAYKYAGPGSKIDPAMYVYRPSTPSNPDPLVGTQFKRENLGGLVDKNITDLSKYEGSQLSFMPWDNSSRNMKITQVSGVDIPEVITHGGQDYPRDIEHVKKGIGGASGKAIAKRIKTREDFAREENLAAGGTGKVIHTPTTMAEFSENYSVQPTQVLLGLIDKAPSNPKAFALLDESIRNYPKWKTTKEGRVKTFPYKDFAGVMTEQGRNQLMDISSFGGDLRKVFVSRAYLKSDKAKDFNFQRAFGFNAEDIQNAILAPDLVGINRGYGGNALITSGEGGMVLQPSKNATYNTDMANMEYLGSLGYNVPVEVFMGQKYLDLAKEQMGKAGDLRSNTLGAIEKRFQGVSSLIDEPMLRRVEEYKKGLLD